MRRTLFLQEARRSAALLPGEAGRAATADIDALLRLVRSLQPPDSLDGRVRSLATASPSVSASLSTSSRR